MQTFTGRMFFPADPRGEDMVIEDVAHALSMLCRFGGHCREFYSVAEHSWHVSNLVPPEDAYAGLMHDATEAYLVDMPKPAKVALPQYKEMEDRLWAIVSARFNLPAELPESVHLVDRSMLHVEHDRLLPAIPPGETWGMGGEPLTIPRPVIRCWGPKFAEMMFLDRYKELTE